MSDIPLPPKGGESAPAGAARSASPARRDAGGAPDSVRLSLQSFLPYRLSILAQTVSETLAAVYSPAYGLSPPEWRIISTLAEFLQMTATQICHHSGMHKATISRAVLALEKRQFLLRNPSPADRREEILSLTPEGQRVYETIAPMALRYEQNLLEGLSRDDLVRLDRLIRHLMDRAVAPLPDKPA